MSFGTPEKNNLEVVPQLPSDALDKEIDTLSARLKLMQAKAKPDTEFIKFLTDKLNTLQSARDAQLGDLDFAPETTRKPEVPKSKPENRFDVDGGAYDNAPGVADGDRISARERKYNLGQKAA